MIRIPAPLRRLAGLITALVRGREAVAAVEFALIMPVMLTMYLGSIELSQAISVDQRVTVIAGTVGDLVARSNGEITATNLTDYFQAAQSIIAPYTNTGLTQVVSLVSVSSTGVTNVLWSQAYNGATAKTVGQPYPGPHAIPTTTITMWDSNYVIVSEASYSYQPLLGLFFKTPFSLYHQNFYLPRYPGKICYNTASC